jgi:hypothetical protein
MNALHGNVPGELQTGNADQCLRTGMSALQDADTSCRSEHNFVALEALLLEALLLLEAVSIRAITG